jgi:RNA polymerase sigma-70 factor (ECF subfamily)
MNSENFREQVWPLRDKLYRIALRVLGAVDEAEDVVQETMIKLWEQRADLNGIQNLESWCVRLTRNLSIDKQRGGYRKRRTDLDAVSTYGIADSDPAQRAQVKDTWEHVDRFLREMPEPRRSILHLRDVEEYTYQEICDTLDLSLSRVKIELHRGRKHLREALLKSESYGL